MFEKITPEQAGISSSNVADFISLLERRGLATHSVLMMKGDKIFAEYYWTPFHKDFCHRMYSQTKSYVGVAIGLLEEDGLIDLDRPMVSYFPEKIDGELHPFRAKQTIREMLTMQTPASCPTWFTDPDPDRTHLYINQPNTGLLQPCNTTWRYDSPGSQVLASLVEKISGKSLFDFLNDRIFKELGTFKTATVLKTKNDDSWGDSALVCTSRDMASFGRFVLNYGTWNGKRLMNEAYLRAATSPLVSNDESAWPNYFNRYGYGYQIWCTEQGGFAFVGMGDQITIMHPATDTVFVITSDNQGYGTARNIIAHGYFDNIITPMQNKSLAPDPEAEKVLADTTADLKLKYAKGLAHHENAEKYNGKTVKCVTSGQTGFSKFTLFFNGDCGELHYTNEQGDKVLPFGICHNVFCKFPELGYSNEHGGTRTTDGFMYDAAVSAAWRHDGKLIINCQIIDRYFGNFSAVVSFNGEYVAMSLEKTAEDFLGKYQGKLFGKTEV